MCSRRLCLNIIENLCEYWGLNILSLVLFWGSLMVCVKFNMPATAFIFCHLLMDISATEYHVCFSYCLISFLCLPQPLWDSTILYISVFLWVKWFPPNLEFLDCAPLYQDSSESLPSFFHVHAFYVLYLFIMKISKCKPLPFKHGILPF